MGNETVSTPGTPLRNSLWNLLYRVVSSTDFSRIAWTTVLRGAALAFIREPIDELPLADNVASRRLEPKHLTPRSPRSAPRLPQDDEVGQRGERELCSAFGAVARPRHVKDDAFDEVSPRRNPTNRIA